MAPVALNLAPIAALSFDRAVRNRTSRANCIALQKKGRKGHLEEMAHSDHD
jgi:hypothetical protein